MSDSGSFAMLRQFSVSNGDGMTFWRDVDRNIRVIIKLGSKAVNHLIDITDKVIDTGCMVNRLDNFLECARNIKITADY